MDNKLNKDFYKRDARVVAKELLGKIIVRKYNNKILCGKIVETEAYIGAIDKACHAYGGKKTPKIMVLYEDAGTVYVYSIYGMYFCLNVITGEKGDAQGVLIRAIEPLKGMEHMSYNRYKKTFSELKNKEILNLTSGPSKLCMALNVNKELNKKSFLQDELFICEDDSLEYIEIINTTRIGISYAQEAANFPWRYYIKNNSYVSKRV